MDEETGEECPGCAACLDFSELGLRITYNVDRVMFLSRRTGCISGHYCDIKDHDGIAVAQLRHLNPAFADVVEHVAENFGAYLAVAQPQRRHELPPTKAIRLKAPEMVRRRCISEAHAAAQFQIAQKHGLNPTLSMGKDGRYVVSWPSH